MRMAIAAASRSSKINYGQFDVDSRLDALKRRVCMSSGDLVTAELATSSPVKTEGDADQRRLTAESIQRILDAKQAAADLCFQCGNTERVPTGGYECECETLWCTVCLANHPNCPLCSFVLPESAAAEDDQRYYEENDDEDYNNREADQSYSDENSEAAVDYGEDDL
jgi:hypothetical protein